MVLFQHVHRLLRVSFCAFLVVLMLTGCATQSSRTVPSTTDVDPPTSLTETRTAPVAKTSQIAPNTYEPRSELDVAMESLVEQISTNFSQSGKTKIAIFDFVDLQGNTDPIGMFIAEELITRLFQSGQFEVVERRLLDKVLDEQKLTMSGLVEAESVQRLGSILGVKAIVTGTVTNLTSAVKINARIIAADTGSLSAAAGVSMKKDADVKQLLGSQSIIAAQNKASFTPPAPALPPKTFFLEDFSSVSKGLIPSGWIGGETFVVKDSTKFKGKNIMCTVSKGPHSFIVRGIAFPEDWTFEAQMIFHDHHKPIKFEIGELSIGFSTSKLASRYEQSWLNNSEFKWDASASRGQLVIFTIEKRGTVLRALINGKEHAIVRIPGLKQPNYFRFFNENEDQNSCGIYKIEGKSL